MLRFVCAIDYLSVQKVRFASPDDLFTTAYWLAAVYFEPGLELENPTLRNRAIRCWKSDSVQALYERVRYRSVRQGSIRLQNKLFVIGDAMADAASDDSIGIKAQRDVAETLIKIVKLVDQQEQTVRAERTKRGLDAARQALEHTNELSNREYEVLLKAARNSLGAERFKALVEHAGPST
jgi:hypothetical protein